MREKKQEMKEAIAVGKILIAFGVALAFIAVYTDFFSDIVMSRCSMVNIIYGGLLWFCSCNWLEKLEAEEKLKMELPDIEITIENVTETEKEESDLNTKE